MNRVVLSGRLAGRPKLSYTPCGIAVAEFRLLVPKERVPDPPNEPTERIDCIAFREAAQDLTAWGERDYRVNLEGRLRGDAYWDCDGKRVTGLRVFVDRSYFVDPVAVGLGTDPDTLPRIPLPTAIPRNGG
jgi:single-strand DNA-binding protein